MNELENVKINEASYNLEDGGNGTITVFIYTGISNPKIILDEAIRIYTDSEGYHELIDANLDNPWMRVIMSDINKMTQRKFAITDRMKKQ